MSDTASPSRARRLRAAAAAALCVIVDLALLAVLAVAVVVILTGGGIVQVGELRIRARSVENPIWILTVLISLRYALGGSWPILGVGRWSVRGAAATGIHLVSEALPARVARLFSQPARALVAVGLGAFALKALIAWTSPGFFSGDDVEVHEMSLGVLLGKPWPVWELRNAFFPMTFIYPAQWFVTEAGTPTPHFVVFAGRAVVALLSTAALPLTWLAARRLAPAEPRLAAFAVLFLVVNKLHMSFGSSELPRPVSTVFVVAAFLLILQNRLVWTAAAGILLGVAAAFRYSELVFIAPALMTLGRERYGARAAVLMLTAAAATSGITALADAVYWGTPFSSLAAAIDYTLVQGKSSRGYEPPWEYLRIIPAWSTLLVVAFAVAGSRRAHAESWWLWTPIVLLSLLPHKESRYLVPVIPFLAISAARGLLRATEWVRRSGSVTGPRRWARELFCPVLLLSVLHDAGGWRLARSNEGARLAQYVGASGSSGIAAEDVWRLGGRSYLWHNEPLVAIPPAVLEDEQAMAGAVAGTRWVALRSQTARTIGDPLMHSLGFARDESWRGEEYVLYVRTR